MFHVKSLLSLCYKNNSTPPQKVDFLGGVAVLRYFHQFLSLGDKKNFGKNLGQLGTFEIFFGHISAISGHKTTIEFQKIRDFTHFWANLGKFWEVFFQNEIFVKIGPQNTKNGFKRFLWILKMIFMHFMIIFDNLKIWLFEHFLVSNRDKETEVRQHVFSICPEIDKLLQKKTRGTF